MDYRTFDLTLISAKGLKKFATLFGKSDVYAVAYIYGADSNEKFRTPVDKNGGSNPIWNFPIRFTVDYAAILQKRVGIVVEIKAVGILSDKKLGEVRRPFAVNMLKGVSTEGTGQKVSSYQVLTPSGKPEGYLSFLYRFSGKFFGNVEETVTDYLPMVAVGSSFTSAGYASRQGYRNPPVHQRSKKKEPVKVSRDDLLAGALVGM